MGFLADYWSVEILGQAAFLLVVLCILTGFYFVLSGVAGFFKTAARGDSDNLDQVERAIKAEHPEKLP